MYINVQEGYKLCEKETSPYKLFVKNIVLVRFGSNRKNCAKFEGNPRP